VSGRVLLRQILNGGTTPYLVSQAPKSNRNLQTSGDDNSPLSREHPQPEKPRSRFPPKGQPKQKAPHGLQPYSLADPLFATGITAFFRAPPIWPRLRCEMRCSLRVVEAINLLCDTPAAGSALKGEVEGLRRLRVGHDRVVYEWLPSELVILVVRIGHRRHVYR